MKDQKRAIAARDRKQRIEEYILAALIGLILGLILRSL